MRILFLSLAPIHDLSERGIYPDLLRRFVENGHFVRVVSPEAGAETKDTAYEGYAVLRVATAQVQKAGFIKKGIATLRVGPDIRRALENSCPNERYDLILMATPPVTLAGVVRHIKRRDGARVYLMVKDIWPQAIADLGVISPKGLIYRYYRGKEKALYALADRIGCTSQAHMDYIRKHNPQIDAARLALCPNSIEPVFQEVTPERRNELRKKYGVPPDKPVFLYGGNLGRPQGIPFLIRCLRDNAGKDDRFFVICGTGTDYEKLKAFVDREQPENVRLINGLPREEFEELTGACDVGLIFLDYRFTTPNFPSRLLSYMQAGLPVIACTDSSTDVGDAAVEGGFGWKCLSDDPKAFTEAASAACRADRGAMGDAAREYLLGHYTAERCYQAIMNSLGSE